MSQPWPNNPDDDGDFPWEDEEKDWEEEGVQPPWLESREAGGYWQPPEEKEDAPRPQSPYNDFTEIPAWQKAHRYALRISQILRNARPEIQKHPALVNLRHQSYLAAVDIAYGHDEGYGEEDSPIHLEHCRQSLGRIHQCLVLIDTLHEIRVFSPGVHADLFNQTIALRDMLVHWMEQVRRIH